MARSIFISRDLPSDDFLVSSLENAGFTVHAKSLIKIEPIEFQPPYEKFDWIFLASSIAAELFLTAYSGKAKIGTAGKATSETVRRLGFEVSFEGFGGDMQKVGSDFKELVGAGRVLFPGAQVGSKSIISHFPEEQTQHLFTYKTLEIENPIIPDTEVVFLSSPSNARAFLQNSKNRDCVFVAIGNTTENFLLNQGLSKVIRSQTPEPESILRAILQI